MNLKQCLAGSLLAAASLAVQAAGADSFYGTTLQLQDGQPLVAESLRGVPFVVVFDRNGNIVSRSKKLLTTADIAAALATPPK